MAINDIYLGLFLFRVDQSRAYMVRPYRVTAQTGTGATPLQIAQAMWVTPYREVARRISTNVTAEGVAVRLQRPGPGPILAAVPGLPPTVRPTGAILPPQCCALIKVLHDGRGSTNAGRVYLPYPMEANVENGGELTAAGSIAANQQATWLFTAITAGTGGNLSTLSPVVWSKRDQTHYNVLGWVVNKKIATQRRRSYTGSITPMPYGTGPPDV